MERERERHRGSKEAREHVFDGPMTAQRHRARNRTTKCVQGTERDRRAHLSASPPGRGRHPPLPVARGTGSAGTPAITPHRTAPFFTVKALLEHNSSRPRSETTRVNAELFHLARA